MNRSNKNWHSHFRLVDLLLIRMPNRDVVHIFGDLDQRDLDHC